MLKEMIAGNWRRRNNYGEKIPPRKMYLRWKRFWKYSFAGVILGTVKYSEQENITREGNNVDGDILYE